MECLSPPMTETPTGSNSLRPAFFVLRIIVHVLRKYSDCTVKLLCRAVMLNFSRREAKPIELNTLAEKHSLYGQTRLVKSSS